MKNIPLVRQSACAKCAKSDIIMAKTDGPVGTKAQYTNIFGETFTEGEPAYYLPGYEDAEVVTIRRKEDGRWYAQHPDGAYGGLESSLYTASRERFERFVAKRQKGGAR